MRAPLAPTFVALVLALALSGCGTTTYSADDGPAPQGADTSSGSPAAPSAAAPESDDPAAEDGGGTDPGDEVPAVLDFSARTVEGEDFRGSELAGRPTVLWFWAPWCPTCRGQIDAVSAAAGQHSNKVSFVGVGSLDGGDAIGDFAADVPAKEITQLTDPDGDVWRHFGITEQSTYVVLDADGRTLARGYLDDAELLDLVGDLAG